MHRFFADDRQADQLIIHDRDDVKHLQKVLRLKVGDQVELVYQAGLYLGQIVQSAQSVHCQVIETLDQANDPYHVSLIQGLPKGQKLSDILQHGTEVGVDQFIICQMDRSVPKLDLAKQSRYQRIVKDASKQSKRLTIPEVQLMDFAALDLSVYDRVYFFYEDSTAPLQVSRTDHRIAIIIGPEGGFSQAEVDRLRQLTNVQEASLGRRILRTETAGLVASAIIRQRLEFS